MSDGTPQRERSSYRIQSAVGKCFRAGRPRSRTRSLLARIVLQVRINDLPRANSGDLLNHATPREHIMVHARLNDAVSARREMRRLRSVNPISYATRQLAGEDGSELVGRMMMRCNGVA